MEWGRWFCTIKKLRPPDLYLLFFVFATVETRIQMQREWEKKKGKNLYICNSNLGLDPRANICIFFLSQFLNCELIKEVPFFIQFYDVNILSSRIRYPNQIWLPVSKQIYCDSQNKTFNYFHKLFNCFFSVTATNLVFNLL